MMKHSDNVEREADKGHVHTVRACVHKIPLKHCCCCFIISCEEWCFERGTASLLVPGYKWGEKKVPLRKAWIFHQKNSQEQFLRGILLKVPPNVLLLLLYYY